MNEIEEFLKTENARISCGNRWLYIDEYTLSWVVLSREYKARNNTTHYCGDSLTDALKALKGED